MTKKEKRDLIFPWSTADKQELWDTLDLLRILLTCSSAVGAASFPAGVGLRSGCRQGVGSSAPARAHLPWHRLTCVSLSTQPYFPFLALTVPLLVSVFWHFPLSEVISSLPEHPIQAGAGWSWKEAAVRTIQCDFRLNVSCPILVIIAGIRAH